MFRSKFVLYVLLLLTLVLGSTVSAQTTMGSEQPQEKILSFDSYIQVETNSDLIVTETITVQSFAEQIRHGITRDFPTKYRDKLGRQVEVRFRLLQASLDDQATSHREERLANGLRIYLGDAQQLLPPGIHVFRIQYRVDHELGYFQDYDELYWNVTGNGWTFPIDKVNAIVVLPPQAVVLKYAAYTGYMHEKGQDYNVEISTDKNRIEFTTTRALNKREGFTIAVSWPKGFVKQLTWQDEIKRSVLENTSIMLSLIAILLLLGYFSIVWYLFGKEPPEAVIIPLYNPPTGFSPAAVRYLAKFDLDTKSLVAMLINFAVKRRINIKETNTDYILTAVNLDHGNLTNDEASLLDKLFANVKQYIIPKQPSDYDQAQSARELYEKGSENLIESLQTKMKNYFKRNLFYFFLGVMFSLVIVYLLVKDSHDSFSIFTILFVVLVSFFMGKTLWANWQANSQFNIVRRSFRAVKNFLVPLIVLAIFLIAGFFSGPLIDSILLLILLLIIITFYFLLRVYTPEGQKIMDKIRGLKMFLNTTEKYRLAKWQPPEKTPELYERLLPYAIALDVENNWTEQFKEVLSKLESSTDKTVFAWYTGPSAFNGLNFSNSISNGFTSAMLVSSSLQAPGSSSGISGGGSSGGGGGGGGGGGW